VGRDREREKGNRASLRKFRSSTVGKIWGIVPFLSSIVTVSFAHFIKNLEIESKVSISASRTQ